MNEKPTEMIQIDVALLGRHFTIATPREERDTLLDAVHLLEDKIETIRHQKRVIDTDKVIIMAALNIAHDFLKTKVGEGLDRLALQRRIRTMSETVDAVLRGCKEKKVD